MFLLIKKLTIIIVDKLIVEIIRVLIERELNIFRYMVACVNEFADRFNLNGKEASNYLNEHRAINFLLNNYEIENTLSIDDAIDHIFIVAKNNRGTVQWFYITVLILSLKTLI